MPRVAREGDKGIKGVIDRSSHSHVNATDERTTATVGTIYLCKKHSAKPNKPHRLENGCQFYKIDGKPVAMRYATKATCGCRIIEGSDVHYCCPHLDAKAKRLAEREILIEQARDAAEAGTAAGVTPDEARILLSRAEQFERLSRDVRFAEMSAAAYQTDISPSLTRGFGNAPEGMIRLTDPEFRDMLPGALGDKKIVWIDKDFGFHADVYYDELHGSYTVAYRGTEPTSRADLMTDHDQAHGLETAQYNLAMRIGDKLRELRKDKQYQGIDLQTTGHSMGGGEAAAGGTVGGVPYITFNAAGLHPNTVSRYTEGKLSNTDGALLGVAYNTDYDPLTAGQTEQGSRKLYEGVEAAGRKVREAGGPTNPFGYPAYVAGRKLQEYVDWSRRQTGGRLPPSSAATRYELPTYEREWHAVPGDGAAEAPARTYTDPISRRAIPKGASGIPSPDMGWTNEGKFKQLDGLTAWIKGHTVFIDSIEAAKAGHEGALRRLLARAAARQGPGG